MMGTDTLEPDAHTRVRVRPQSAVFLGKTEVIHLVEDVRSVTSAQHIYLECSDVSVSPGTSLGVVSLALCIHSHQRHHSGHHQSEHLLKRLWTTPCHYR